MAQHLDNLKIFWLLNYVCKINIQLSASHVQKVLLRMTASSINFSIDCTKYLLDKNLLLGFMGTQYYSVRLKNILQMYPNTIWLTKSLGIFQQNPIKHQIACV